MKRLLPLALVVASCAPFPGGEDKEDPISCEVTAPASSAIVASNVEVTVSFSGPVAKVELVAGTTVVATREGLDGAGSPVTMTWDTAAAAEGAVVLRAKATSKEGATAESAEVTVTVDNTAPVVTLDIGRISQQRATFPVPVTVTELNVATLDVFCGDTKVGSATAAADLQAVTSADHDGLCQMKVVATDQAGHTGQSAVVPVIIANMGEEITPVTYDPRQEAYVPSNWRSAEYDTRAEVETVPHVKRLVSWLTWDASSAWTLEYTIGEGLCPHRGIDFLGEGNRPSSDTGEIIIDLPRSGLAPEIVSKLPTAEQNKDTFPSNNDPMTFGLFFGHIRPMEPAEHVNQSIPIEVHIMFYY